MGDGGWGMGDGVIIPTPIPYPPSPGRLEAAQIDAVMDQADLAAVGRSGRLVQVIEIGGAAGDHRAGGGDPLGQRGLRDLKQVARVGREAVRDAGQLVNQQRDQRRVVGEMGVQVLEWLARRAQLSQPPVLRNRHK